MEKQNQLSIKKKKTNKKNSNKVAQTQKKPYHKKNKPKYKQTIDKGGHHSSVREKEQISELKRPGRKDCRVEFNSFENLSLQLENLKFLSQ